VSLQVPSCILPGALMALVSPQGRSNTHGSIVPFCAISVRSHRDFKCLPCSVVQENFISNHADGRFNLEVLNPIMEVVLDIGI
jgi:hypothetical protein